MSESEVEIKQYLEASEEINEQKYFQLAFEHEKLNANYEELKGKFEMCVDELKSSKQKNNTIESFQDHFNEYDSNKNSFQSNLKIGDDDGHFLKLELEVKINELVLELNEKDVFYKIILKIWSNFILKLSFHRKKVQIYFLIILLFRRIKL